MSYKSILVISDTHFPYSHPDTIDFLAALKKKYKPDKVVHIGDEVDWHSISFHDSDPGLLTPSNELKESIKQLKKLYKVFPDVDLLESNHGSLVYRRAKSHGIPVEVFKSYHDMLEAPKGWKWHFDLVLPTPTGKVYFHHSKSADVLRASQQLGMSAVFGHHHNKFEVRHWSSGHNRAWGMFVGCLIDHKSMAFAYGKNNLVQPMLGCGIILDGQPKLLPMLLDKRGRWTKNTP